LRIGLGRLRRSLHGILGLHVAVIGRLGIDLLR
jgi:hypothetical protein